MSPPFFFFFVETGFTMGSGVCMPVLRALMLRVILLEVMAHGSCGRDKIRNETEEIWECHHYK
jgi:hypothetical protein